MSGKQNISTIVSDKALEMVMRDVLDSLSEISLESGFKPTDGCFEIIEIYPAQREKAQSQEPRPERHEGAGNGDILQFPNLRRANG